MAKTGKGILGPFSGKIGPVIGSTWKNISYVKSAPQLAGKKRAPSAKQLANQKKFQFMNEWLSPFYPYVNIGFSNLSTDKTEINIAFQLNYAEALQGVYPDFEIDYTKVCLSKGSLSGLFLTGLSLVNPQQIRLFWEPAFGNGSYNDQLMLVLYSPALKIADGFVGLAKRADGSVYFTYHSKLIGQALEVYLTVVSLNRKKVSNSQYLGRMEP